MLFHSDCTYSFQNDLSARCGQIQKSLFQGKDHRRQLANLAVLAFTTKVLDEHVRTGRTPVDQLAGLATPSGTLIGGFEELPVDRSGQVIVQHLESCLEVGLQLGKDP